MQKTIRFGLIGLGLMGREFASAAARWCHVLDVPAKPEITAICDTDTSLFSWYTHHVSTIGQTTTDYRELIKNPNIDAVYIAVPHNLHEEMYTAVLQAGKHLMGEKPFGIDQKANDNIMQVIRSHPDCLVRCTSEFPFVPAVQRIGELIESQAFGQIIEVNSGFLHSSDLNPDKPINWKRMIDINGEYGVMGDLGMHACHIPFRAGWELENVRAILSNIVTERPDGRGNRVPCKTWDNATLFCQAKDDETRSQFPLTIKTQRIAPGEKNTWYIEILGTHASTRFSTKNPRLLQLLEYDGREQAWQQIDMGHETAFKTITGGIFEFGFSDGILQMWAGYLYELINGNPLKKFAGCVTPEESAASHRLFTAALKSHEQQVVVRL
jgi:predicted dehydrogenase